MTFGKFICSAVLFFFLSSFYHLQFVYAETKPAADIYTLGEIVVSGEREGVESVATVREITDTDIQNKGARTLDEALQLLPGLNIRTGSDGAPRVDLRGFRSRHVILLLDGVPLNSTFDGQFDPSIIPVENIAKIKVSYGDHSVLYGDGGLGGVINIISKRGTQGIRGMLSGEVGDGGEALGRFTASGGSEKVNFFLSGSLFETNGFLLSDDFKPTPQENGGTRENSDERRNNLFANVTFTPSDKLLVGAVINYSKGEFGKPPSTISNSDDQFADSPKFERIDNFEGYTTHISFDYRPLDVLGLRAWLFYNQLNEEENRYDDNSYTSMNNPTVKGSYHLDNTTSITGAALQTKYDLKSMGIITLGLNAREEEFESDGRIKDVKAGKQWAFREVDDDNDLSVYSAALEYEVSPFQKSLLVLGYGHHWIDKDSGGNDNDGSFLIGARYNIFENTRIKGSYARKIRFPSIRQLYEENTGNPDLDTEKSDNYELGIEQGLPYKSMVTLTGFIIDVKDYIEASEVTDIFENNEEYRFQGFELTAENRYAKNLLLRMGYSYLDTEDKSEGTEKDELQYRPKHKFTFEGNYVSDFGLSAYMNILHVSDQVYYSKKAPLIKKDLNDYTVLNLKFDQDFLKGRLRVYLGLDNVLDEDYEESYGFPQAGRFIYGGVTIAL